MRWLMVFMLWSSPAWAVSSKEDCAKYAEQIGGALPDLKLIVDTLERTRYWRMIDGRGDLRAAVEAAEKARIDTAPQLATFLATLEDLTYQLQRCARG